eukprot:gb/GECG01006819.1/.p1 GENE.gb/GECG01006819.1/~~gb/GECG01006819.1/.p1  ORF type:complete len:627 (+),score=70.99 gb/GECG01006819.1/:1-1881(+)
MLYFRIPVLGAILRLPKQRLSLKGIVPAPALQLGVVYFGIQFQSTTRENLSPKGIIPAPVLIRIFCFRIQFLSAIPKLARENLPLKTAGLIRMLKRMFCLRIQFLAKKSASHIEASWKTSKRGSESFDLISLTSSEESGSEDSEEPSYSMSDLNRVTNFGKPDVASTTQPGRVLISSAVSRSAVTGNRPFVENGGTTRHHEDWKSVGTSETSSLRPRRATHGNKDSDVTTTVEQAVCHYKESRPYTTVNNEKGSRGVAASSPSSSIARVSSILSEGVTMERSNEKTVHTASSGGDERHDSHRAFREQGIVEEHLQAKSSESAIIADFEAYFSAQLESFAHVFGERRVNHIPNREVLASLAKLFALPIDYFKRKHLIEHAVYLVKHLKFAIVMIFLDERHSYVDAADGPLHTDNESNQTSEFFSRLNFNTGGSRKRQRTSDSDHRPSEKKQRINGFENYSTFSGLVSNCLTLLGKLRERDDKFHQYFSLTRQIIEQSNDLSESSLRSFYNTESLSSPGSFQRSLISEAKQDRQQIKSVQKSQQLEDSILLCRKMDYLVSEYQKIMGVEKYSRVFSASEKYLIADRELEETPPDNLLRRLKEELMIAPNVAVGAVKSMLPDPAANYPS